MFLYDVVLVIDAGNKGAELLGDSLEAVTNLIVCACFVEFRTTEYMVSIWIKLLAAYVIFVNCDVWEWQS